MPLSENHLTKVVPVGHVAESDASRGSAEQSKPTASSLLMTLLSQDESSTDAISSRLAESPAVVRLLSLGCIPQEEVVEIVRLAPELARQAAEKGKVNDYTAILRVLIQAAKLPIETQPKQVEHVLSVLPPDQRAALIEAQLIAAVEMCGEADTTTVDAVGDGPAADDPS
ncbi:hypothetical protein AB1L30_05285 [Bremerella sp. JC817]|uniref:hypothetical protein n=1 Tax=Bremerella sp. JC817 TaxID=3231756 RepID=UPI003459C017